MCCGARILLCARPACAILSAAPTASLHTACALRQLRRLLRSRHARKARARTRRSAMGSVPPVPQWRRAAPCRRPCVNATGAALAAEGTLSKYRAVLRYQSSDFRLRLGKFIHATEDFHMRDEVPRGVQDAVPRGIPPRAYAGSRAVWDAVSCGITCRAGCHHCEIHPSAPLQDARCCGSICSLVCLVALRRGIAASTLRRGTV